MVSRWCEAEAPPDLNEALTVGAWYVDRRLFLTTLT
jgi:hypothetical protein